MPTILNYSRFSRLKSRWKTLPMTSLRMNLNRKYQCSTKAGYINCHKGRTSAKVWILKYECDILLVEERDNMKKAILILILCAVFLSACGNAAETAERAESVETSAVSQTTTTVTASAVTSANEEKDTSETTTTTKKSSQTVSETSGSMEAVKAKTTKKSTVSSSAVSEDTPQEQTESQSYYPIEPPQENTEVNTTQKPATTIQENLFLHDIYRLSS